MHSKKKKKKEEQTMQQFTFSKKQVIAINNNPFCSHCREHPQQGLFKKFHRTLLLFLLFHHDQ